MLTLSISLFFCFCFWFLTEHQLKMYFSIKLKYCLKHRNFQNCPSKYNQHDWNTNICTVTVPITTSCFEILCLCLVFKQYGNFSILNTILFSCEDNREKVNTLYVYSTFSATEENYWNYLIEHFGTIPREKGQV